MKIRIIMQLSVFLFFLVLSPVAISDSADFLVDMKIIDSGTEVATPQMMVKEDSEASMSISGENPIGVALIVSSSNEDETLVMAEVESGESTMSPEILVKNGQWASVSIGDLEFHLRVQAHHE